MWPIMRTGPAPGCAAQRAFSPDNSGVGSGEGRQRQLPDAFRTHPDDRLCVGCTEWLYGRSRLIARQAYPVLHVLARVREWIIPPASPPG